MASPLAGADKKLKDVLTTANETAGSDWRSPCTGQSVAPLTYLDSNVERILLEQHRHQKRTILDCARLRDAPLPAGSAIPAYLSEHAYLPEHMDKQLPMFARFHVAIVAEAHSQQDQFESRPRLVVVPAAPLEGACR